MNTLNVTYVPTGVPTSSPTLFDFPALTFLDAESLVLLTTSVASCIGCLIMFISLISNPSCLKKTANEILLYVAISNFLNNIGLSFGYLNDNTAICVVQGIMTNIFSLISILWTAFQALLIYSIIVLEKPLKVTLTYHAICWGGPVLFTLLIYTTNRIGTVGYGWCFIGQNPGSPYWGAPLWTFMSYYAWLIVSEVIMVYCLIRVAWRFRKNRKYMVNIRSDQKSPKSVGDHLWLYPLVILVCWTYDGFVDSSNSLSTSKIQLSQISYDVFYLALPGLQGFFTSIIFMFVNKNFIFYRWFNKNGCMNPHSKESVDRNPASSILNMKSISSIGKSNGNIKILVSTKMPIIEEEKF